MTMNYVVKWGPLGRLLNTLMLRRAIELCPEGEWSAVVQETPFWRVVYHTLYYTHLYLQADESQFNVQVETPIGTSIESTSLVLREIERRVRSLPGVS